LSNDSSELSASTLKHFFGEETGFIKSSVSYNEIFGAKKIEKLREEY